MASGSRGSGQHRPSGASRPGYAGSSGRDRGGPQVGQAPEPQGGPRRSGEGSLPEVPASITADQLDPAARDELSTLPGDLADAVARQLIAASIDDDPDRGYRHAQAARRLAARVGVVRETCGIAAYRAGAWADALTELRAARRLTGRSSYLPMMADCERALGRLDRALALVTGPESRGLDRATEIELRIVESGIRRDQGLASAAVVALQLPEITAGRPYGGSARLFYAYADALLDAGREEEAKDWFGRAAAADTHDETDAAERFEDLDEFDFADLDESADLDELADLGLSASPADSADLVPSATEDTEDAGG